MVSSGVALSGLVLTGGTLQVSGGVASSTVIGGGGLEIVSSGGVASGTIISDGGLVELLSGGVLAGDLTVLSGGTLEYFGGTLSGGSATFELGAARSRGLLCAVPGTPFVLRNRLGSRG